MCIKNPYIKCIICKSLSTSNAPSRCNSLWYSIWKMYTFMSMSIYQVTWGALWDDNTNSTHRVIWNNENKCQSVALNFGRLLEIDVCWIGVIGPEVATNENNRQIFHEIGLSCIDLKRLYYHYMHPFIYTSFNRTKPL